MDQFSKSMSIIQKDSSRMKDRLTGNQHQLSKQKMSMLSTEKMVKHDTSFFEIVDDPYTIDYKPNRYKRLIKSANPRGRHLKRN